MRYFAPDIQLSSALPPQTEVEDKFGGHPFGLPLELWPSCASCGGRQTLLAQLRHDRRHLDLLGAGRVLFVFACQNRPGECDDFDPYSGANAAFVVDGATLGNALTEPPEAVPRLPEVRVLRWRRGRVGLIRAFRHIWEDPADRLRDVRRSTAWVAPITRLGGYPAWLQWPEFQSGWRFILQLTEECGSWQPLPPREQRGNFVCHLDAMHPDRGRWWTTVQDFATGIAYVFLRPTQGLPECRYVRQND